MVGDDSLACGLKLTNQLQHVKSTARKNNNRRVLVSRARLIPVYFPSSREKVAVYGTNKSRNSTISTQKCGTQTLEEVQSCSESRRRRISSSLPRPSKNLAVP